MADVLPSDELVDEPSDYGAMQPGTRLGRYELLVPIARGGMARVWAARLHGQRGFQKLVAIKTILPHLASEPEFERMFLDEARIASGVHHPNVCEIYELGEEKKTLYLVMEWVSGDSLARVLRASGKTEPVDPRVVSRVIADACAGLHAAHELTDENGRALGVVHRDLSPHNILLTADGTAKVADFGVAKALGQLHEATSAGQLKGKIAYMAPEQVTGQGVDRRSDVFSLGCVLYEATTGQRPFRGDGDHQVMHAVLKGEFPTPTSLIRNYPQELERIVMRALSPQPILRYPTAERMRFALEEFVARGQLVTQSNVAQVVRARIGEAIDRRKERIRLASTAGDREAGWSEPPGGMTPSNQAADHRSGVKQSAAGKPGRALFSTLQMDRPENLGELPMSIAPPTPQMRSVRPPALPPASSTTIPQASPHPGAPGDPRGHGHTPVSHPGAAYSNPGAAHSHPGAPGAANPFAQSPHQPPSLPHQQVMPPHNPQHQHPQTPPPPQAYGAGQGPQGVQGQGAMSFPPISNPFGPSSGAPAPPSFDPQAPQSDGRISSPPAGAGQYAVAIAAGVLLAVLIGLGGFYAWRGRQSAVAIKSADPATSAAAASSSASATGGANAPASADIVFRITPADATLSIDGVDLTSDASDARTMKRPPMGKTVTVMARAKDHDEVTVFVDFFTTSPLELTLKPAGAAGAAGAVGAADGATSPAAATTGATAPPATATAGAAMTPGDEPKEPPKDPPKKRLLPKGEPALPPNPF